MHAKATKGVYDDPKTGHRFYFFKFRVVIVRHTLSLTGCNPAAMGRVLVAVPESTGDRVAAHIKPFASLS